MIDKFLRTLAVTGLALILLIVLVLRIAFGLALYIIAFGAAYIILWEMGVL